MSSLRLNRLKRLNLKFPFRMECHFKHGLLGFENFKNFLLIGEDYESPFLWLESQESPHICFVLLDPFLVCPHYNPVLRREDLKSLEAKDHENLALLSIVNLKATPRTLNLAAPLLINLTKKRGKQILFKESANYLF